MVNMKITLNKTRSSQERFILINGSMGCANDPNYWPTYKFEIANGIDRGNGYQCYMNLTYALKDCAWFPKEAKENLIKELKKLGYDKYLSEVLA